MTAEIALGQGATAGAPSPRAELKTPQLLSLTMVCGRLRPLTISVCHSPLSSSYSIVSLWAGDFLLGSCRLRSGERVRVGRESFRKHAIDFIGPATVVLDNFISDIRHRTPLACEALKSHHAQNAMLSFCGVSRICIDLGQFFCGYLVRLSEMVRWAEREGARPLIADSMAAGRELRRINWDTWSGMFYSDATAYFIILATAVTLHVAGVTDIETAAQAASALRPLAGDFACILFALGILGVGLIGVPVLAGSAAYAFSEAMGWKWALERKATDARGFYSVIAVSVLAALVIQYSPISPMKALFWSAVINGVVAVPLMAVIILLVCNKSVMGRFTASRPIVILGWIGTAVMGLAAVRMFIPG
jgi:hypothetical protein